MASLKANLARVLMAQVPVSPPVAVAAAPRGETPKGPDEIEEPEPTGGGTKTTTTETANAPIFANYKAVTFPTLVILITGVWYALRRLPVPFFSTVWVPLILSLVLGGLLTWLELSEDQVTPQKWKFWGGVIGLCNCMVLFSAVVGAPAAADGLAQGGAAPTVQGSAAPSDGAKPGAEALKAATPRI